MDSYCGCGQPVNLDDMDTVVDINGDAHHATCVQDDPDFTLEG